MHLVVARAQVINYVYAIIFCYLSNNFFPIRTKYDVLSKRVWVIQGHPDLVHYLPYLIEPDASLGERGNEPKLH